MKNLTPAKIFSLGLNGSFSRSAWKLSGMICMSPLAPLFDTAQGLKFDSAFMIAFIRGIERPCFSEAS
ncbi:MAG: hypothetical protein A2V65_03235 [Deltaproteobacteria bacterium RBG_13_49_15]|nr:MAG: hypothetical protein A2V65_03235 [Deltaproteobacteria bacterium RBG_13_49_15]